MTILDAADGEVGTVAPWGLRVVKAELVASRFDGRWRVLQTFEPEEDVTEADLQGRGFTVVGS